MAAPYFEWAFDLAQASPAQLVSTDDRAIDALVDGSHSRGTYVNGSAGGLNLLDVYPVERIDVNPDPMFFERSSEIVAYVAGDGGLLYEITGVFTESALGIQKSNGIIDARDKSLLFLNGGFFHDDGAGGGSVLYDSDTIDRADYTVIGVQGNIIGAPFTISIRDSDSVLHSWNSAQWQDFYNSFFTHVILARDDLEAAVIAIEAAIDAAEIQAALDNIPPPNNTI